MVKFFKKLQRNRLVRKEKIKLLKILQSDLLNIDKCVELATTFDLLIPSDTGYNILKKYHIPFHTSSLANLLASLKFQLEWIIENKGNCNSTGRAVTTPIVYRLDIWCLDGIETFNYINIIKGWKSALWYIIEISKLIENNAHKKYISKSLFFELDTFIKLSSFLIEVILV